MCNCNTIAEKKTTKYFGVLQDQFNRNCYYLKDVEYSECCRCNQPFFSDGQKLKVERKFMNKYKLLLDKEFTYQTRLIKTKPL